MARVGCIGLGTMGGPMAGHLLDAGHEVGARAAVVLDARRAARMAHQAVAALAARHLPSINTGLTF